ncbi:DUF2336 domain-containing protein [Caenispirillum bisanense]|uniref:Uncharacterized conserved protein, DUF2336 family n=1 Tax=Caenispirillum bisanense TaxID=414052 RepID=A0A286GPJ6_9PROT|nr:DUF2336 domain-containing protein [Caenispirillum bisanense]SOD96999.1 Uncharacterized conserved protein, DUF2336 family [Caenispirillum bisanense]
MNSLSALQEGSDADPAVLGYEEARALAADPRMEVRQRVAALSVAPPEVLYYLAQDAETAVRLAVAANPGAPAKANLRLADDADESVRAALAAKVADLQRTGLLPPGARAASITFDVLDRLSRDRLTAVRAAVADGLKDVTAVDPSLVRRLARDVEILVAAPILEFSPILDDQDLLDIIRENAVAGALAAIARRAYVGAEVTEAIVASGDARAVTHLLYNAGSQLQEHTLDSLISSADREPDWQLPLARRAELPEPSVRRLAEMVADHVLARLMERGDLTPEATERLREVVNNRLDQRLTDGPGALPSPYAAEAEERFAPLLVRAREMQVRGELTEGQLMVSLLTDHVDDLVAGLAVLADQPVRVVLEILASQSPRAVAALARAAGVSARFGLELQVKLGRIAHEVALKPLPDGGHPVTETETAWQIEMYAER